MNNLQSPTDLLTIYHTTCLSADQHHQKRHRKWSWTLKNKNCVNSLNLGFYNSKHNQITWFKETFTIFIQEMCVTDNITCVTNACLAIVGSHKDRFFNVFSFVDIADGNLVYQIKMWIFLISGGHIWNIWNLSKDKTLL